MHLQGRSSTAPQEATSETSSICADLAKHVDLARLCVHSPGSLCKVESTHQQSLCLAPPSPPCAEAGAPACPRPPQCH